MAVIMMIVIPQARSLASVTFLGDWTDFGSQFQKSGPKVRLIDGQPVEWLAGRGPNHWRIVQERGPDRLQVVKDPTSPKGGPVLQIEIHPGDSVGYTGERAEVSQMNDLAGLPYPVTIDSGHEVYGVSIKLDSHWQPPANKWRWGEFMQLHGPNDFGAPPAFSFAAEDDFHVNTCAGDLVQGGTLSTNKAMTSLSLTNGSLRTGHWVQFLIDVVWAYDNHGSLTIYRRDDNETSFSAVLTQPARPTLQFSSSIPNPTSYHYWKAGYYRSISPGVTSKLWLGPIVRGTSMNEVAIAAFGRP
jgi:hypothetical protein